MDVNGDSFWGIDSKWFLVNIMKHTRKTSTTSIRIDVQTVTVAQEERIRFRRIISLRVTRFEW
jgi:hypothetical protein